jgi:hypothetical protein
LLIVASITPSPIAGKTIFILAIFPDFFSNKIE